MTDLLDGREASDKFVTACDWIAKIVTQTPLNVAKRVILNGACLCQIVGMQLAW